MQLLLNLLGVYACVGLLLAAWSIRQEPIEDWQNLSSSEHVVVIVITTVCGPVWFMIGLLRLMRKLL